ncbi:Hypothetical protein R9X50_00228700 [Acrodontium crateriforme]|uniref:BHLH domain-containing protein n=1 Tax=Acrodontium crateriforme TaxID=150365 RepID=A0AAQ3RAT9_9PEZI|nr:Hypothetical protein R9X50_00228700 [Acrodontium crateriforme]
MTAHRPPALSPPLSSTYSRHLFFARRPDLPVATTTPIHTPATTSTTNRTTTTSTTTATLTPPSTMPRPLPPPTPGSSSDLRGKDAPALAAPAFHLPPTAFPADPTDRASTSSTPSANGSDSSYRPVSPASPPDMSRKRQSAHAGSVITKEDFALPPPPTRSRKIIQMKPKDIDQDKERDASTANASTKTTANGPAGGKRKQANAGTTAAGRKIARKTAHSLIERRRRSKMNEEFGVLKDMIPACKGQEMHKLAILQASIDYLRYLEQCVSDLQGQNKSPIPEAPAMRNMRDDDDEAEDEEMEDDNNEPPQTSGAPTPASLAQEYLNSNVSLPSLAQMTSTTSPAMFSDRRNYSISSASQASYSPYFHSNQASPAFGPQLTHAQTAPLYGTAFGLGSPALKPIDSTNTLRQIAEGAGDLSDRQRRPSLAPSTAAQNSHGSNTPTSTGARRSEQELDHEATAALLMLNSDRRSWRASQYSNTSSGTGGMSVRDLLSG